MNRKKPKQKLKPSFFRKHKAITFTATVEIKTKTRFKGANHNALFLHSQLLYLGLRFLLTRTATNSNGISCSVYFL